MLLSISITLNAQLIHAAAVAVPFAVAVTRLWRDDVTHDAW
jgi:hypothetical protein